jgi:hypothetical protein
MRLRLRFADGEVGAKADLRPRGSAVQGRLSL